MPLLVRAALGPNDGGYAVVDYGAVEPGLGDDRGISALLASTPRRPGMALCVDLVLNHTAAEHPVDFAAGVLSGVRGPGRA